MTFKAQVMAVGGGEFSVKPGRPVSSLTVKEAAARANCSAATIYRLLLAGIIHGQRPSPRKMTVDAASLEAHLEGTANDPEYWTAARRAAFRNILNV